ncbi:excisionase [Bacteroidia bacterium]|nr:excisionase [Bacteroidia bacterium]
MFIEKEKFNAWMERIMERFDRLENKINKEESPRYKLNGELLFDNQDLCLMLKVSKRTLQRYRSAGKLPFKRIEQKTYYLESDVHRFIREYLQ